MDFHQQKPLPVHPIPPLLGDSVVYRRVLSLARRFATVDTPILLIGPTGTGKDLLARHIHAWSGRAGPFVDVNCGAIPRELAEMTLFGARRGAYTGSVEAITGLVEAADGGSLLLNEACSLAPDLQVKLLDTLETGEYRLVGDCRKRRAGFRLIAVVQEGIGEKIATGAFRRDLYERLAGVVIELPALAERPDDILTLAEHFSAEQEQVLEHGAARLLVEYKWPGNVRELRRVIERAGCLVENGVIPPAAVVEAIAMGSRPLASRHEGNTRRGWPTRAQLLALCEANAWEIRRVSAALGIHRTQLYARFKAAGTSLRDLRTSGSFAGCTAGQAGQCEGPIR